MNSASGELDVVPESCCWDHEVDYAVGFDPPVHDGPFRVGLAEGVGNHLAVTDRQMKKALNGFMDSLELAAQARAVT